MSVVYRGVAALVAFAPMLQVSLAQQNSTPAADKAKQLVNLKVGDSAPVFSGVDDKKKVWKSEKFKGKKILVVYFYPADMTPGCTAQAIGYRDTLAKLKRKDIEVIGISGDKAENHQHFCDKYKLNFTLLADPEGKIAKAFGVKTSEGGVFQRELAGKEITFERGVTAKRWTFIIDKQWRIAHVDRKVQAAKDSEKVFKLIEKLP